jgi:hypothetical protein
MEPTLAALLGVVAGLIGGFLTAFATQKGKNKAMAQDIAELTRVAKDIEAKISNEMWIGQRNWQAKRDVAYELARETATFQESVVGLLAFWNAMKSTPGMMAIPNPDARAVLDRHKNATGTFWRAKLVGALLLDQQVITQVEEVERKGRMAAALMESSDVPPGEDAKRILAMNDAILRLLGLLREDLLRA